MSSPAGWGEFKPRVRVRPERLQQVHDARAQGLGGVASPTPNLRVKMPAKGVGHAFQATTGARPGQSPMGGVRRPGRRPGIWPVGSTWPSCSRWPKHARTSVGARRSDLGGKRERRSGCRGRGSRAGAWQTEDSRARSSRGACPCSPGRPARRRLDRMAVPFGYVLEACWGSDGDGGWSGRRNVVPGGRRFGRGSGVSTASHGADGGPLLLRVAVAVVHRAPTSSWRWSSSWRSS